MPTSVDAYAVDTSVAVAALDGGHAAHVDCRRRVMDSRPALAGHAAFETFSVLTRMPGALRLDPPSAADDPDPAALVEQLVATVAVEPARIGESELQHVGGAIYDALVGEAARANGRTLLTRDRRAMRTYDLLGVVYELV